MSAKRRKLLSMNRRDIEKRRWSPYKVINFFNVENSLRPSDREHRLSEVIWEEEKNQTHKKQLKKVQSNQLSRTWNLLEHLDNCWCHWMLWHRFWVRYINNNMPSSGFQFYKIQLGFEWIEWLKSGSDHFNIIEKKMQIYKTKKSVDLIMVQIWLNIEPLFTHHSNSHPTKLNIIKKCKIIFFILQIEKQKSNSDES